MGFKVRVEDKGLKFVEENGAFESEVHHVAMLTLPDEEAMKKSRIALKHPQPVPMHLITLLMVSTAKGKILWANAEHCTVIG